MHPEASRILANIVVLLNQGLFQGKTGNAVLEAIQFVEGMIAEGNAKTPVKAEDANVEA